MTAPCDCLRLPRVGFGRGVGRAVPTSPCLEGPEPDWSDFEKTGSVSAPRTCRVTGLAWTLAGFDDCGRIEWGCALASGSRLAALVLIERGEATATREFHIALLDLVGRHEEAEAMLRAWATGEPPQPGVLESLLARLEERKDARAMHELLAAERARYRGNDWWYVRLLGRAIHVALGLGLVDGLVDEVLVALDSMAPPSAGGWVPSETAFGVAAAHLAIETKRVAELREALGRAARRNPPSLDLPFAWALLSASGAQPFDEAVALIVVRGADFGAFREQGLWAHFGTNAPPELRAPWQAVCEAIADTLMQPIHDAVEAWAATRESFGPNDMAPLLPTSGPIETRNPWKVLTALERRGVVERIDGTPTCWSFRLRRASSQ